MRRLWREEGGFTLPEVLVTTLIMIVVMFALYSIFDMSLRVFSFGNDKIEAVENARVAIERMERELRSAYPNRKWEDPNKPENLRIFTVIDTNASEIRFGTDSGSGSDPAGNRNVGDGELIHYYVDNDKLYRKKGSSGSGEALANIGSGGSLQFKYYKKNGTQEITPPFPLDGGTIDNCAPSGVKDEHCIDKVRMSLTVEVDGRTQTLATDVALRNRKT